MPDLILDFLSNYDNDKNFSLSKQYEKLKNNLINPSKELSSFIEEIFSKNIDNYDFFKSYIFQVSLEENKIKDWAPKNDPNNKKKIIPNVIFRFDFSSNDHVTKNVIPKNFDLIITGNIILNSNDGFAKVNVTKIDLINKDILKSNEQEIECNIRFIFSNSDWKTINKKNPLLTNNFIDTFFDKLESIQNLNTTIDFFKKWCEYIDFRKYYLSINSNYSLNVDSIKEITGYAISKKDYYKNEEKYKNYLLNSNSKDEQLVLSSKIAPNCEEVKLICLKIIKNKLLTEESKNKTDKLSWIRSFTRESLWLSSEKLEYDNESKITNNRNVQKYSLNERYLFAYKEILPDCTDLRKNFTNNLSDEFKKIDDKYNKEIENKIPKEKYDEKECIEIFKKLRKECEEQIDKEKEEIKKVLNTKLDKEIKERNYKETNLVFSIYFKKEDKNKKLDFTSGFLSYDNRAERTKILRQESTLNSLYSGNINNPYIPKYLFDSEHLPSNDSEIQDDPNWQLETLNDVQKKAVKKILSSNGLFLLQGPPGTGKTQVIAEITAQFSKQNKKVLISSETHKAIDNVFDRLPKIPEIRPLRLINSYTNKETNYGLEKLVDNFYKNISDNLKRQIKHFKNFQEVKESFNKLKQELKQILEDIEIKKKENSKVIEKIKKLNEEKQNEFSENKLLENQLHVIESKVNKKKNTLLFAKSYFTSSGEYDEKLINDLKNDLDTIIAKYELNWFQIENLKSLINWKFEDIEDDINKIIDNKDEILIQIKKDDLKEKIKNIKDDNEEKKSLQTELVNIINSGKKLSKDVENNYIYINFKNLISSILNEPSLFKGYDLRILPLQTEVDKCLLDFESNINKDIEPYKNEINEINKKIKLHKEKIKDINEECEKLNDNPISQRIEELENIFKTKIKKFFSDFDITKEYDPKNLQTAIDLIDEEQENISNKISQDDYQKRIECYEEICKHLNKKIIIETDRNEYTEALYNCANVFGVTCTSNNLFKDLENNSFGIEEIDLKKQDIDVVIIDEVSKSSFLDLVIPIIYGKTIVFVGDHRQLPPTYDLRHLKKDDFDELNSEIVTKKINDEYTSLYEECFFKKIFEKIPDDYKIMLNKQYRCHSDIMNIFNHFYSDGINNKGLEIGFKDQDERKQHNLTIKINNKPIIDPKKHIYFVDCSEGKESTKYEGSTSKINEIEADVTIKLLKELDLASEEHNKNEKPLSVGVICTYGDQASIIKNKVQKEKFSNFSKEDDEKLVISTVDDFQGDERDIIILSMVRNPNDKNFNPEFIKKYERINVALSRARKMLIIVGAKKFLCEHGWISLPSISGDSLKKTPIYRQIIDTIETKGRILEAKDILGDDYGK